MGLRRNHKRKLLQNNTLRKAIAQGHLVRIFGFGLAGWRARRDLIEI